MKIIADAIPVFDVPVSLMDIDQCRALLDCILEQAAPQAPNSMTVLGALVVAEQRAISTPRRRRVSAPPFS